MVNEQEPQRPPPRLDVIVSKRSIGWMLSLGAETDTAAAHVTGQSPAKFLAGFVARRVQQRSPKGTKSMLWTIVAVLVILWALGVVTTYTLGGFIHILLFAAVVIVVMRIFSGRRIA